MDLPYIQCLRYSLATLALAVLKRGLRALPHDSSFNVIMHVHPQYNAVSAWVPASFAVPKLLPGLPAWMSMKKKKQTHAEPSDGEKPAFRQVDAIAAPFCCCDLDARPGLHQMRPASVVTP